MSTMANIYIVPTAFPGKRKEFLDFSGLYDFNHIVKKLSLLHVNVFADHFREEMFVFTIHIHILQWPF